MDIENVAKQLTRLAESEPDMELQCTRVAGAWSTQLVFGYRRLPERGPCDPRSLAKFQLLAEYAVRALEPGRDWDRLRPVMVEHVPGEAGGRGYVVDLDPPTMEPASMRSLPPWRPGAQAVVGLGSFDVCDCPTRLRWYMLLIDAEVASRAPLPHGMTGEAFVFKGPTPDGSDDLIPIPDPKTMRRDAVPTAYECWTVPNVADASVTALAILHTRVLKRLEHAERLERTLPDVVVVQLEADDGDKLSPEVDNSDGPTEARGADRHPDPNVFSVGDGKRGDVEVNKADRTLKRPGEHPVKFTGDMWRALALLLKDRPGEVPITGSGEPKDVVSRLCKRLRAKGFGPWAARIKPIRGVGYYFENVDE